MKREIIFVISQIMGGGAERIIVFLSEMFCNSGYDVYLVLTNQSRKDICGYQINEKINLMSLPDELEKREKHSESGQYRGSLLYSIGKKSRLPIFDNACISHFKHCEKDRIEVLSSLIKQKPYATVVAFLQYSIQLSILAVENLPNRLIASERNDPKIVLGSVIGSAFIRKKYQRIDKIVFQTRVAMELYPPYLQKKGVVICNPLAKSCLQTVCPKIREKIIVDFCRISKQKNLPLLVEAFSYFHKNHPDYTLKIVGDASTDEGMQIKEKLLVMIKDYGIENSVIIDEFNSNIHEEVSHYMMFVSSSSYEGLSNSMLEALAVGLPTICNDCSPGSSREIIDSGINGIVVENNNALKLAEAMSKVADDEAFAASLSENGLKIRKRLNPVAVFEQWKSIC